MPVMNFQLEWREHLGEGWMNLDNLKMLLFSDLKTKPDLVEVIPLLTPIRSQEEPYNADEVIYWWRNAPAEEREQFLQAITEAEKLEYEPEKEIWVIKP